MTSDIVAATLAGLGPMMMQRQRKPVDKYASRRQFGDALLLQGAKFAPVTGGVVEGLARAGTAALGGWMAGKADRDQTAEDETQNRALIEAIAKSQVAGPNGTTTFDFSPVAQALAARGDGGTAAYLMLMDQLARRQQGQTDERTRILTGGAPPGGAPPGGAPPGGAYPQRVSITESPNGATNPQSGASGFYQFMPRTAVALAKQTQWGASMTPEQILAVIRDPNRRAEQGELMKLYTAQSDATLTQAGIPVNDVTRFALHAFGPAGGVSLLKAPDNMPVAQWVASVNWDGASPQQVIAQNGLAKYQTVGQLKQDFIARRIGGGQPQPQAAPPAAPPGTAMAPPAPVAQPPQAAPPRQVGAVEGQGIDDSGQDRGFGTVPMPPSMVADDGSRDMIIGRQLLAMPDPASQRMGEQYLRAGQAKQAAAQQRLYDRQTKPSERVTGADDIVRPVSGGAADPAVIEGDAAARARGSATGGGVLQPGVDPNTGAPGLVNPLTGDFKPSAAPFTEAQGRSATFADRMTASERNLREVEGQGTSALGAFLERLGVGGNYFQTPEYQRYEQARRDFINAQLRRESGAVISPEEFANAEKQYFPRPGDSPQVIEQKRRNRQIAIDGMGRDAGPSYKPREAPKGGDALQQARDAIARGAPREKVIERLRSLGVDPGGL